MTLEWGAQGGPSWPQLEAAWEDELEARTLEARVDLKPRQRLIICSDVVYEPSAYEPLLRTLVHLTTKDASDSSCSSPRVVMAHRSRHPDEHQFWEAAAKKFHIHVVDGSRFCPLGSNVWFDPTPTQRPTLPSACPQEDGSTNTIRILELVSLQL